MSTLMPATARRRIGLLGHLPDPAAQLLQDVHDDPEIEFVTLVDPGGDAALVDEVVILSQDYALAHLVALRRADRPCRLILRRQRTDEEAGDWELGLSWLAEVLARDDWPDLSLWALGGAAAELFSARLNRPVAALPALARPDAVRPRVPISRRAPFITFTLDADEADSRRAEPSLYNWARLRRLADLVADDPEDHDLADLVSLANGVAEPAGASSPPAEVHGGDKAVILCVVPNGVGLGHVTRMMAIATALKASAEARVIFWSFSRAAEILRAAGFEVILRQTANHLAAHPPDWRAWETLEFSKAIQQHRPQVITYDGGTFDPFMIEALKAAGCGRTGVVWVRRGLFQPDTDPHILESEQYCDLVLEPGDLARPYDKGPTATRLAQFRGFSRMLLAAPVTLKPYLPAYDARTARRKLGLGRGRHCLMSLGGAFGDWDQIRAQIIEAAERHRVKLVWAQSPLAGSAGASLGDTLVRRFYPLSRYLSAFDGMVTATGYNSYHELMLGYDGPVLLTPTNHERIDDQVARVVYAGDRGWASVVRADVARDQSDIIDDFMAQVRRGETVATRPDSPNGAEEMAAAILEVCRRYA